MISSCCSTDTGSKVTVTETATNLVVVVDGVPTVIPKLRDCDGDDLVGGTEVVTCADLNSRLCGYISSLPITTSIPA